MKRASVILFLVVLIPISIIAQDDSYSITRNGNSITITSTLNGITGSSTLSKDDLHLNFPTSSKKTNDDRSHERNNSTPLVGNYEGLSSEDSWGQNGSMSNELYERMKDGIGLERSNTEAMSVLSEMEGLLSADCIDIEQLQGIQARFNSLSSSQKSALGYEGEEAFKQLKERLDKARALYSQNITIALNIKNNMFSSIDKKIMLLPYEEQNGYLKQFISKEEFDRAKIEYERYEKAQVANNVLEKIRNQKLRKKNDSEKAEKPDFHLTLQKVRRSYIDNYKVGAMAVKTISDGQKQLTNTFGEEYIPKSELLERLNDGINTVNEAKDIKGILVKAFLGDSEGALSDYRGKVKETIFDPLKNCAKGLGATVTGSYNTVKRVFNFKETMTTITKDTWNGVENAIREAERGNCDAAWKILFRTEQKDLNTTKKGINNAF